MKKETKSSKKYQWIVVAVLVAAVVIVISTIRTKKELPSMPLAPHFTKQGELTFLKSNDTPVVSIDIEIADSDAKRELGLMGRPTLNEREGMLFVFEEEHIASFWMKNTILPLDMIFVNKYGVIVTIHQNTTPFSEQSYSATAPTLFVVEVNAGFTQKYNIQVGDKIVWHRVS